MNASSSTSLASFARSLCAVVLLMAGIAQAPAQSILSVHDEAAGTTRVFTPGDASFFVSGDGTAVNILVDSIGAGWFLRFEAPEGERLAPGSYDLAGCPFQLRMGRAPGLGVTDNNPVCNTRLGIDTLFGAFVIRQIAYDTDGKVASLEALFTQRKDSPRAPVLAGLIRYEARPFSLAMKSEPGFVLGAISQDNHGDSSVFALEGTVTDGIDYKASVRKDTWRILIAPPTGVSLRVGRYSTAAMADTGHAGLLIFRGLDQPARCPDAAGRLDIQKMRANPAGTIQSLQATFEYRCSGTRPALRGTIRYGD